MGPMSSGIDTMSPVLVGVGITSITIKGTTNMNNLIRRGETK